MSRIPENLQLLHRGEELLRGESVDAIEADARMLLHVGIIECALDVLDTLRAYPTDDEDLKVIQVLGMRQFNAFASAIKLALSGYYQNSGMILRDVLETAFLVDYFRSEGAAIAQWRQADGATRWKHFGPAKIREALDKRDGNTSRKREQQYKLFSELAGHASMKGIGMLRPKGGDAHIGPFFDVTALAATLDEMGQLAVQVGEVTGAFLPADWPPGRPPTSAFGHAKVRWMQEFYPGLVEK